MRQYGQIKFDEHAEAPALQEAWSHRAVTLQAMLKPSQTALTDLAVPRRFADDDGVKGGACDATQSAASRAGPHVSIWATA